MVKILLLALLSAILLTGCGEDDKTPNSNTSSSSSSSSSSGIIILPPTKEPTIPGDAQLGKSQYQQYCVVCHGEAGEGNSLLKSPSLVGCSICEAPVSLSHYIDTQMPPGGATAAKSCSGDCAVNVAAFIVKEFNKKLDTSACANDNTAPSPSVFKRLSRQEYSNTLTSLLQLDQSPNVEAIPDDPSVQNFQTIASIQGVQPNHLNGYLSVATEQAEALMNNSSRRDRVLGCDYTNSSCLGNFVRTFGRLAYRRPLTTIESDRISQFVTSTSSSAKEQFVLTIQVLLSSPNFIYRVEIGNSPEGLATLDSYELASRLSFALWGRGPTSELLDQAEAGDLDSAEGLKSVAQKMLNDPKAKHNMSLFFEQWLATNLLKAPVEKPANWYDGILDDMRNETNNLLGDHVWKNKSFMSVFTTNQTYLSSGLASYYGLAKPSSPDVSVSLPSDDARRNTGILTHAANMFAKTDGDLVAIRGNWLRSTFLCKKLELPDGISEIINGKFSGYTPIQIIEARNTDGSCNRCHSQIDPIGIAFTPFQRDGLFDHSVDLSDYPIAPGFPDSADTHVTSLQDIAQALSQMPEVGECLANRLFLYTRSHLPEKSDQCTVHNANQAFVDSGYHFTSLLLSLVESPTFRSRVAPVPNGEELPGETSVINIALGKSVSTSSAEAGNPGMRITDDDIGGASRWSAQTYPQQAVIDLGGVYAIVQTEVYPYEDRSYRYTIETSVNGSNYTRVVNRSTNTVGGNVIRDLFAPVDARYIRINITGASTYTGDWISLREVKIFGTQN